jgi:hypothetical protein
MNIDLENREIIDPRRPNGLINSALNQLYNNIRYTTIFNAMVRARMICQNINDNDDVAVQRIRRVVASDVSYYAPGMLDPIILDDFILEEANQSIIFLETELIIARGEQRIDEINQHIGYIRGLIEIFHLELNNMQMQMQQGGRKNKSRRKNKKSRKSRKSRKQ